MYNSVYLSCIHRIVNHYCINLGDVYQSRGTLLELLEILSHSSSSPCHCKQGNRHLWICVFLPFCRHEMEQYIVFSNFVIASFHLAVYLQDSFVLCCAQTFYFFLCQM